MLLMLVMLLLQQQQQQQVLLLQLVKVWSLGSGNCTNYQGLEIKDSIWPDTKSPIIQSLIIDAGFTDCVWRISHCGFRNSLMNGQFNPSCTIKFSLNCQQFLLVLGNLFISPTTMCHWAPIRFKARHLGLLASISFRLILFYFIKGDRNEPPTLGDTQIKPRQIMAERQQCAVCSVWPLEKWRLVAGTSHLL